MGWCGPMLYTNKNEFSQKTQTLVFSLIVGTFASDARNKWYKVLIAHGKPTQSKTAEKGGGSEKPRKTKWL